MIAIQRVIIPTGLLAVIALLLLAAISPALLETATSALNLSAHAVAKHGDEALLVRQCLEKNGPMQIWRQDNGRLAQVCLLPDGKFGISIDDDSGNVTAFIKNKMRTLRQVEQYLRNKGAQLIWRRP